jgi:hypothetical protein
MPRDPAALNGPSVSGEEAVKKVCDHLRDEGMDPYAATVLSLVTWEELTRAVVTALGQAGVISVEWPDAD